MTSSLWDLTLTSFRDRTASSEPTPGGGAVCAVSGSLALGLVSMALEITRRRCEPEHVSELDAALADLRVALTKMSAAADEDVRVFAAYMVAHRLPKQTVVEQQRRTEALRLASHAAAGAPMDAAQVALDGLALAERAAALASAHVLSDVTAGAELLHAAIVGLMATVTMNLRDDDDSAEVEAFRRRRDQLAARADRAIEAARAALAARLAAR